MTSRRAFAESEHQQKLASRSRHRQAFTGLVAVVLAVLTVAAVATDKLLRPGAFPIKELRLEGEFHQLDPEDVRTAVVEELGDNYFSIDLKRIEKTVENLPWVYKATVKRSWPLGLKVRVEEQRPVARWGENGWLNDKGQIVRLDDMDGTATLVLLNGPDSTARQVWRKYNEWKPLLDLVDVEIEAIYVDERFSWRLVLTSPDSREIQILLGLDDHDNRLRRFAGSYPALVQDPAALVSADLRYPNGLAVTRTPVKQEDLVLNEVAQ